MIMGVIETDWLKAKQHAEPFDEALEALNENREEGETMDRDFFRSFDMPVHPQYVVDRLQELRFSNL